jgi:hypothetical protein
VNDCCLKYQHRLMYQQRVIEWLLLKVSTSANASTESE